MTTDRQKAEQDKKDKQRAHSLQKKYVVRITTAKQAREAFLKKDYTNAAKKYHEYLSILAESKDAKDIYSLSPTMFDPKKDVAEVLLISHVYWEMARIHELTPKLQKTFYQCLSQFVKFTINQPFQVLNSEMLRKYIKKNKRKTPRLAILNDAYSQIFVQSKKCYIATICFGESHTVTNELRVFKNILIKNEFGQQLVRLYYLSSHHLTEVCERSKLTHSVVNFFFKLPIWFLAKTHRLGRIVLCLFSQK